MMADLSILIPTHNRGDILGQTLESIAQLEFPENKQCEVVVVANACTDHTPDIVRKWESRLPIPCTFVDDSIANLNRARNLAANNSSGDILAYLDDDVWVEKGWANALLEAFNNTDINIAGGKIDLWWKDVERPAWFTNQLDRLLTCVDYGPGLRPLDTPFIAGANLAIRRSLFDSVGGFLEGLDRSGENVGLSCGDSEFIQQAQDYGSSVYYVPNAVVRHWVAPHRITSNYLFSVASANAAGRIYMKPKMSPMVVARGLIGNAWLTTKSLPLAAVSYLANHRGEQMGHLVRARAGVAALGAYCNRLRGKSPVVPRSQLAETPE